MMCRPILACMRCNLMMLSFLCLLRYNIKIAWLHQRMVAQLAARSCGDLEVMGSDPTIHWETFGLNPQTRSSRISRIPPKVGPDQPVVYTKKKKLTVKNVDFRQ